MGLLQRRLEVIILTHLWGLTPLALAWLLVPRWRDPYGENQVQTLGVLAAIAIVYLATRTWLTLKSRPSGPMPWP